MTDGSAREIYERWIRAQGGDPDLDALPRAPVVREVVAPRGGVVTRLAALPIGIASLELGGGRRTKDDEIDHSVGVVCSAKRGQTVEAGQVLADVHARDEASPRPRSRPSLARLRDRRRGAARHGASFSTSSPRCPSCRRSRRSGRSLRHASRGERSRAWRSSTHASRGRTTSSRSPRSSRATASSSVERRGKYLLLRLESGFGLLVHLRMTGGFHWQPVTHERAVLELDDGTRLVYRDVRRFGTWLVLEGA